MTQNNNRITELEMIVMHQTQTIEELSIMVAEQWKVIDAMRKKLDDMSERFHLWRKTRWAGQKM